MPKPRILILCTGNSARSQMAEGILRALCRTAEVSSAGTHPTRVHPLAIEAMREIGIDISAQRSKSMREFLEKKFDAVITVCDTAAQECPAFPRATERIHWSIEDPAAIGSGEEKLAVFRRVRDVLRAKLAGLLRDRPSWQMKT